MIRPKDVLVVTTATLEGRKIERHLKPVTAHIVAGANFFSDLFASFSDVFGGRSGTYQMQLTSLYNEAIQKIQKAAHEIGANGVVGLSIDMDEISGKSKSMFMLTAIGTAVVLADAVDNSSAYYKADRLVNVSHEHLATLHRKKEMLRHAKEGVLGFNEENWKFIIDNKFEEILPFLFKKYSTYGPSFAATEAKAFYDNMAALIDGFPDEKKIELLYDSALSQDNEGLLGAIGGLIRDHRLLDLDEVMKLLRTNDFNKQRLALRLVTYSKPYYNQEDVDQMREIIKMLSAGFPERGQRTTKKQLLSSKEKEVWLCECGTNNDINGQTVETCSSCGRDIYGFRANSDVTPKKAIANIEQKVSLIQESLA